MSVYASQGTILDFWLKPGGASIRGCVKPLSTGLFYLVALTGFFHPPSIKFDPDIPEH